MGAYKRYKVIDSVQDLNYEQWVSNFVQKVLRKGKIEANEVELYDIYCGKRFCLKIDGTEYFIRAWDYTPYIYDDNNYLCVEKVEYALYKDGWYEMQTANGTFGMHGIPIVSGETTIKWDNEILRKRLLQTGDYGENEDPLRYLKKKNPSKKYNITYTTVDKRTRNYVYDLTKDPCLDDELIDYDTIRDFIQTKKWPDYITKGELHLVDWGLNPVDPDHITDHRPTGHAEIYDDQWETYHIVQKIMMELAKECTENFDLRESLFQEAKIKAAVRDKITVDDISEDCEVGHVGALNNAIYAADFHYGLRQVKEKALFDMACFIESVIEEYELLSLIDITPM